MAPQFDASDPLVVFGAVAALIFLGFAGNLIFSRFRLNDTLLLILVGVLLGPVFGFLDSSELQALSAIVGPLALILILFDGGLALNLRDLMHGLGNAAVLGVVGFVATAGLVGAVTAWTLHIPFTTGLILGAILGGTSALVVLPSLEQMRVEKRTGTTLGLESALTDILVVVVSFTLISIAAAAAGADDPLTDDDVDGLPDAWERTWFGNLGAMPGDDPDGDGRDHLREHRDGTDPTVADAGPPDDDADGLPDAWERQYFGDLSAIPEDDPDGDGRTNVVEYLDDTDPATPDQPRTSGGGGGAFRIDAQGISSKLLITFAMSLFMGIAAGLAWLFLYPRVREKPFGYMLTLGFMFALYVFVEWILKDVSSGGGPLAVLAFGIILGNYERFGRFRFSLGDEFGRGMKRFQGEISFLVRTFFFVFLGAIVDLKLLASWKTLGIGLLIFLAMAAARYLAVLATTRRARPRGDDLVLLCMMPRGLAAAVLAAEPAKAMIPGTESFVALAFLILVLSNVLSTVGGMVLQSGGTPTDVGGDGGRGGNSGRGGGGEPKPTPSPAKTPASRARAPAKTPVKTPPKTPSKPAPKPKTSGGKTGKAGKSPARKTQQVSFRVTGETEDSLERMGRRGKAS